MKRASYLFRIDDVCPTMDWDRFGQLEKLFTAYGIRPIIGIVPDNRDSKLVVHSPSSEFWPFMKELTRRGWTVAQHGYQHMYNTKNGGLLGINQKSEFAGLPYDVQKKKIQAGKVILEEKLGQNVRWWMAPAHSFDEVTCRVLVETGFTHVTDGIALSPFQTYNLTWVPAQLWRPRAMPFGLWTVCLHPNTMTDTDMEDLIMFLRLHARQCQHVSLETHEYAWLSPLFRHSWYFALRFYKLLKHDSAE